MSLSVTDLVGGMLGLTLTLSIFSFLLKDNALFRIAVHLFIGVIAGYSVVVAWFNVIWPRLLKPIIEHSVDLSENLLLLVPLVMSGFLLTKLSRRLSRFGSPVMAFLIGVGVAAAVGGAILGTLYPQVQASINVNEPANWQVLGNDIRLRTLNAGVILISTFATLIYFQFRSAASKVTRDGKSSIQDSVTIVGKICIAIALGVIFAGVYISGLSALVDRIHVTILFVVSLIKALILP